MKRRLLYGMRLLLTIELVVVIPLLALTSFGGRLAKAFAPSPTPTPRLGLLAVGTPPTVQAEAAYLMDADSGHVLLDVHGQERLPMASTTKITTAILTIETADLTQVVPIKQDAIDEVNTHQGSSAGLVVGDQIRLRDLLYGLMLPSGDDAAIAIADAVGGTVSTFVQQMNQYAQRLGLTQTHYLNPDGLTYLTSGGQPDPTHYSSAADLVRLTRHALTNPVFAQLVQLQHFVLFPTNLQDKYVWDGINALLSTYPGATGVKTGFTEEAGYCLVFSATNGRHHLIGALLHEPDDNQRFVDARALLDWGLSLPVGPLP